MAIAYHRLAIKEDHAVFSKAEKLYEMIVQTLMVPNFQQPVPVAIRTVALNNLADLYHLQGRTETTQQVVQHLSPLIVFQQQQLKMIITTGVKKHLVLFSGTDIDSMILNLMLWKPPQTAAAA
jgi:hypothetical protein